MPNGTVVTLRRRPGRVNPELACGRDVLPLRSTAPRKNPRPTANQQCEVGREPNIETALKSEVRHRRPGSCCSAGGPEARESEHAARAGEESCRAHMGEPAQHGGDEKQRICQPRIDAGVEAFPAAAEQFDAAKLRAAVHTDGRERERHCPQRYDGRDPTALDGIPRHADPGRRRKRVSALERAQSLETHVELVADQLGVVIDEDRRRVTERFVITRANRCIARGRRHDQRE